MPGVNVEIPGWGRRSIRYVVSDYTGTLSCRGVLGEGVRECLQMLKPRVELHILTADTRKTAEAQLQGVLQTCAPKADGGCSEGRKGHLHLLKGSKSQDVEKQEHVRQFGELSHVAALGNGLNDRLLLETIAGKGFAIAVDNGEGCAVETLQKADVFIVGGANALKLLLDPLSLTATLRSEPDPA